MGGCTALRDKQYTQLNGLISDERLVAVYQMNFSALKKDTLERSWIFGKKFTTNLLLSATNKWSTIQTLTDILIVSWDEMQVALGMRSCQAWDPKSKTIRSITSQMIFTIWMMSYSLGCCCKRLRTLQSWDANDTKTSCTALKWDGWSNMTDSSWA